MGADDDDNRGMCTFVRVCVRVCVRVYGCCYGDALPISYELLFKSMCFRSSASLSLLLSLYHKIRKRLSGSNFHLKLGLIFCKIQEAEEEV